MSLELNAKAEGAGEGTASTRGPKALKRTDELICGRLLDHGREPYRFNSREAVSYFVRIETSHGRRTVWGKDLERALQQSATQPRVGEEIGVRRLGSEKVTVKRRERDAEGHVVKEEDLPAHRFRWVPEKREFFEARARAAETFRDPSIEPADGARKHPELVGSYLNLHAAELVACRIRHPDDRKKFVALVRNKLADAIARGEFLQAVRLRERAAANPKLERGMLPPAAEGRSPSPARGLRPSTGRTWAHYLCRAFARWPFVGAGRSGRHGNRDC